MNNALGLAVCFLVALHAADAAADTITIRSDDWCPYTCAPDSQKPGYLIEIAREALGKAGHSVDYSFMPWTRVVKEVEDGKVDAAAGAGRGDIPSGVFHRQILGKNTNVLAVKTDSKFVYTVSHRWKV